MAEAADDFGDEDMMAPKDVGITENEVSIPRTHVWVPSGIMLQRNSPLAQRLWVMHSAWAYHMLC
jgi:hypothetical protein